MLPEILIGPGTCYWGKDDEDWLQYWNRIGPYRDTIDFQFLTQICYEHGERFNDYFPGFDLERHSIARRIVTAQEVRDCVRYDDNVEMDFWHEQFDSFNDSSFPNDYYMVHSYMMAHKTWPFPPVIIDNIDGFANSISDDDSGTFLGRPWHLIEGTHRVSYLNRMLELGMVKPDSEHVIFWLSEGQK